MAHSISYWYDIMSAERETMANLQDLQPAIDNTQQLLSDLSTSSRVIRWRLMLWIVATAAYALEVVFDLFKSDLEEISINSRYGTLPWYSNISLKYQHGDALIWQNNNYEYATLDTSLQIIKRVAVSEAGPSVLLKVAKLSGTTPAPLNPTTELVPFTAYISARKPAGIVVNIVSDDPDYLKLYLKVNYDPLVMSGDGSPLSSPGTYPVHEVIESFIANLPFDGRLELIHLIDVVQEVEGVQSAYVQSAYGSYGAVPYQLFDENYYPNAGYMIIDPSFPLDSTITYANV